MTAPTDPRPRAATAAWIWLGCVLVAAIVRLPTLVLAGGEMTASAGAALTSALFEPAWARIARASGVSRELAAAIQQACPSDGRLVIYSPYGGAEFELDPGDPRGTWARLARTLFERTKNLLYPNPRDVHFARDADELLDKIEAELAGRLLVLDGTQEPVPLTVGGEYELVHTEAIGSAQTLRLWRLVRAK